MNKDKIISCNLKNVIKQQQKVINQARLIKPNHVVKEVCTWKARNYKMKQIKEVNIIDETLKLMVDHLNVCNFSINGTTNELNEMLFKLKGLSKDPQYAYLVEEFLNDNPEYVTVIYPELKENN